MKAEEIEHINLISDSNADVVQAVSTEQPEQDRQTE